MDDAAESTAAPAAAACYQQQFRTPPRRVPGGGGGGGGGTEHPAMNNSDCAPAAMAPSTRGYYDVQSPAQHYHQRLAPPAARSRGTSSKVQLVYQSPRIEADDTELFPHGYYPATTSRSGGSTQHHERQQQYYYPRNGSDGFISAGANANSAVDDPTSNVDIRNRLRRPDDRWSVMSEYAGQHKQDMTVFKVPPNVTNPSALKFGMPRAAAKKVTTLYLDLPATSGTTTASKATTTTPSLQTQSLGASKGTVGLMPSATATTTTTTVTSLSSSMSSSSQSSLAATSSSSKRPSSRSDNYNALPEWLDAVSATFENLEHLYLNGEDGGEASNSKTGEGGDVDDEDGEDAAAVLRSKRLRRLYVLYRLPYLKSLNGQSVSSAEHALARPADPNGQRVRREQWMVQTLTSLSSSSNGGGAQQQRGTPLVTSNESLVDKEDDDDDDEEDEDDECDNDDDGCSSDCCSYGGGCGDELDASDSLNPLQDSMGSLRLIDVQRQPEDCVVTSPLQIRSVCSSSSSSSSSGNDGNNETRIARGAKRVAVGPAVPAIRHNNSSQQQGGSIIRLEPSVVHAKQVPTLMLAGRTSRSNNDHGVHSKGGTSCRSGSLRVGTINGGTAEEKNPCAKNSCGDGICCNNPSLVEEMKIESPHACDRWLGNCSGGRSSSRHCSSSSDCAADTTGQPIMEVESPSNTSNVACEWTCGSLTLPYFRDGTKHFPGGGRGGSSSNKNNDTTSAKLKFSFRRKKQQQPGRKDTPARNSSNRNNSCEKVDRILMSRETTGITKEHTEISFRRDPHEQRQLPRSPSPSQLSHELSCASSSTPPKSEPLFLPVANPSGATNMLSPRFQQFELQEDDGGAAGTPPPTTTTRVVGLASPLPSELSRSAASSPGTRVPPSHSLTSPFPMAFRVRTAASSSRTTATTCAPPTKILPRTMLDDDEEIPPPPPPPPPPPSGPPPASAKGINLSILSQTMIPPPPPAPQTPKKHLGSSGSGDSQGGKSTASMMTIDPMLCQPVPLAHSKSSPSALQQTAPNKGGNNDKLPPQCPSSRGRKGNKLAASGRRGGANRSFSAWRKKQKARSTSIMDGCCDDGTDADIDEDEEDEESYATDRDVGGRILEEEEGEDVSDEENILLTVVSR